MVCLAVLLDATSDGLSQLLWVQCGRWGGCTLLLASRRPGVVDCEDGNVVGGALVEYEAGGDARAEGFGVARDRVVQQGTYAVG